MGLNGLEKASESFILKVKILDPRYNKYKQYNAINYNLIQYLFTLWTGPSELGLCQHVTYKDLEQYKKTRYNEEILQKLPNVP